MLRSKATPPGARVPLIVLFAALAAGAVMFLQVHRSHEAAEHGARAPAASPAHVAHEATAH